MPALSGFRDRHSIPSFPARGRWTRSEATRTDRRNNFLPRQGKVDSERSDEDGWGETPNHQNAALLRTATPTPTPAKPPRPQGRGSRTRVAENRHAHPDLKGGEVKLTDLEVGEFAGQDLFKDRANSR